MTMRLFLFCLVLLLASTSSAQLRPGVEFQIDGNALDTLLLPLSSSPDTLGFFFQSVGSASTEVTALMIAPDSPGFRLLSIVGSNLAPIILPTLLGKAEGWRIELAVYPENLSIGQEAEVIATTAKGEYRFVIRIGAKSSVRNRDRSPTRFWIQDRKLIFADPLDQILINDAYGRLAIASRNAEVPLHGLSPGVYFARVLNGDLEKRIKFVYSP